MTRRDRSLILSNAKNLIEPTDFRTFYGMLR